MQCLNHLGVCVLLQPTLCNADTSCDAAAVRMAVADPSRFTIKLQPQPDATTCVNYIDNGGVPPPPPAGCPRWHVRWRWASRLPTCCQPAAPSSPHLVQGQPFRIRGNACCTAVRGSPVRSQARASR